MFKSISRLIPYQITTTNKLNLIDFEWFILAINRQSTAVVEYFHKSSKIAHISITSLQLNRIEIQIAIRWHTQPVWRPWSWSCEIIRLPKQNNHHLFGKRNSTLKIAPTLRCHPREGRNLAVNSSIEDLSWN